MNRIRIVADSSCDLITLDEVSFVSVPLTIRTETQEFRDDASLDVETMVDTLRSTKGRSYSACPSVADWSGPLEKTMMFLPLRSPAGSQEAFERPAPQN